MIGVAGEFEGEGSIGMTDYRYKREAASFEAPPFYGVIFPAERRHVLRN